jgi:manganese-dependent inorganic pyrophosphatase
MFRAVGERPTRETAGILIAGIVTDTILFQSPTTTDTDRSMCTWLERLCGESAESIMEGLFSVDSPLVSMSPEQAVLSDAKSYSEGGKKFMLGQIEEPKSVLFHQHLGELSDAMDAVIAKNGLDFFALMSTDPVRGNSELLYRGIESVRKALPYRKSEHGTFLMPGVMSRKKQLLPEVLSALS